MAEPSDVEAEQKKLESRFHPIMQRIYQSAGGAPEGGAPGAEGMPRGGQQYGGAPGAGPQPTAADDLD